MQKCDCHQQDLIVYLKFAKKVDLSSKNRRKEGKKEEKGKLDGERKKK